MARDNPVYLAYCPECDQLVGASAILLDEPEVVREALRDKADWERQGWRVEVGTNDDVRCGPWGHIDTCSRRRGPRKYRVEQATLGGTD